jgi:hypothetical protein
MLAAAPAAFIMHHFGLWRDPPRAFLFLYLIVLFSINIKQNKVLYANKDPHHDFRFISLLILILSIPFYKFSQSTKNHQMKQNERSWAIKSRHMTL